MRYEHKRSVADRRREYSTVTFPFRCANDTIVNQDRRVRCERRIRNIEVAESGISRMEFMSLLKHRYANKASGSAYLYGIKDIENFDECIIKD